MLTASHADAVSAIRRSSPNTTSSEKPERDFSSNSALHVPIIARVGLLKFFEKRKWSPRGTKQSWVNFAKGFFLLYLRNAGKRSSVVATRTNTSQGRVVILVKDES